MDHIKEWEAAFADALKSIARRSDVKACVEADPVLYPLLRRAAARFVTGDARQDGLTIARNLSSLGYRVSLEYIGENTTDAEECNAAAREMEELIGDLGSSRMLARVSFDLSHIGLRIDDELAYENLMKLAATADKSGIELFISMEESAKTDEILAIHERAARIHSHVGITLQAHLHRSEEDARKLPANSLVRVVKGAYKEPDTIALPRSGKLNERFLTITEQCVRNGHRVSFATHDESLIEEAIARKWPASGRFEFETLYGIKPDLSAGLQEKGQPVRIYLTYGREWYLYLCHRIAEFPPNLYRAVTAMIGGEELRPRY
ncbi:proline dehydrogenase family protein [Cohnella thailandensis]|uniref:proline dehydrogenase n=1 Tax=Cohnella thailandensis TaxID=557557 RepID=A0A841TB28_9BACL|nr:proline dehydrogenase family protein [Cohnella thailandensis]MBB6638431.1 proline dehydrogenase family protein [Cohnella thailandensis]MBP1977091.1 proline dehydrogenase [Cohnella thailandensis]